MTRMSHLLSNVMNEEKAEEKLKKESDNGALYGFYSLIYLHTFLYLFCGVI